MENYIVKSGLYNKNRFEAFSIIKGKFLMIMEKLSRLSLFLYSIYIKIKRKVN